MRLRSILGLFFALSFAIDPSVVAAGEAPGRWIRTGASRPSGAQLAQADRSFAFTAPAVGTKFTVSNGGEQGVRTVTGVNGLVVTYSGFRAPGNRTQEWSVVSHLFADRTITGNRLHTPELAQFEALWPAAIGRSIRFDSNRDGSWWRNEYKVRSIEMLKTPMGELETLRVDGTERAIPHWPGSYDAREAVWYAPSLGLVVRAEITVLGGTGAGRTYVFEVLQVTPP